MKDTTVKLARHRLERAREAFRDAELLLAQGALISAANRYYYAAFYAARACLATEDVDSGRHSGVISLFQQGFVKTGRMDPTIAKALPRAFEKRQKTDSGDFATLTDAELQQIRQEVAALWPCASRCSSG